MLKLLVNIEVLKTFMFLWKKLYLNNIKAIYRTNIFSYSSKNINLYHEPFWRDRII